MPQSFDGRINFKVMENETDTYEKYIKKIPYNKGKHQLELKYVYGNEIGKGANGYVMCGYRVKDHCSVAIKVVPSNLICDWYYSTTLQMNIPTEVLLMAILASHDGVISILEYYDDQVDSNWYIIMERFGKAIDLFEYICSTGFLTENLACHIFYQLTLTIIDCHIRGVVHRDIKEENILIDTSTKKVWLIDFGSGGLMKDDNHYTYTGTMAYAPPEWIKYGHYRGCQMESWSLGIVLYSMLCGSVPFDDEQQIINKTIGFPRNISNNCKDLILKCLERDPKKRIQPLEILTHPWILSNLNNYDSGHGSFDEAYLEDVSIKRKCSCSCAEGVIIFSKEDHAHSTAAIETVHYDSECIKEIDPEWRFRVFSKSLSPDMKRKNKCISSFVIDSNKNSLVNKSTSVIDIHSKEADLLINKLSELVSSKDFDYEEDIDDNFQMDDESIVYSGNLYSVET